MAVPHLDNPFLLVPLRAIWDTVFAQFHALQARHYRHHQTTLYSPPLVSLSGSECRWSSLWSGVRFLKFPSRALANSISRSNSPAKSHASELLPPTVGPEALNSSPLPPATLPQGERFVSYVYCRMCRRDPCRQPAATMCGHIFCHQCVLVVLSTRYIYICGRSGAFHQKLSRRLNALCARHRRYCTPFSSCTFLE